MTNERLGTHALTSARAWIIVICSTWLFSEGAGFAALAYSPSCSNHTGGLYSIPVLPPATGIGEFLRNAISIWVNGLYYSGLTYGFCCAVICLVIAACLTRRQVAAAFSWAPGILLCACAAAGGWAAVIHQIVSTGRALCAF